jgi:hypothetical protein
VVRHAAVRRRPGIAGGGDHREQRFFRPADATGAATAHPSREWDWGPVVARLIRAGHQWSDIQRYTLSQIKVFLRGARQVDREDAAESLLQGWMAANLDGDQIKDALRTIKGE